MPNASLGSDEKFRQLFPNKRTIGERTKKQSSDTKSCYEFLHRKEFFNLCFFLTSLVASFVSYALGTFAQSCNTLEAEKVNGKSNKLDRHSPFLG